jgi:hypothetical protein
VGAQYSEKEIWIYNIPLTAENANANLEDFAPIDWLTPDALLMRYSRGELEAYGLEDFRSLTEFALYYIGISKSSDSFSRLFKKAHEKRSRILGNETQFSPRARLTDELTIFLIFLFNIEDLQMLSWAPSEITSETFKPHQPLESSILASDAEKAFIKFLQTNYNDVKYPNYPKSSDGLYGIGFDRYSFFINDCISFKTPTATIRGARLYDPAFQDLPDLITIDGDDVELLKPEAIEDRVRRGDLSLRPDKA